MIATMNETTTMAEALSVNLVADRARTADYADGTQCSVCHCYVQGGERIADLTGGSGVVHVARCAASAAPPAPRRQPQRPAAQAAWHDRTVSSAQPSPGRQERGAVRAG